MSAKDEYLVVEVVVMVKLGPDSEAAWPESRCAAKAAEIRDTVNETFAVSASPPRWWVQ